MTGWQAAHGRSWGRDLRVALLVGTLAFLAAALSGQPVSAQDPDQEPDVDVDLYVRGGEVYQANCAACHGTRGQGGSGEGVLAGPPVDELDLSYVDLTVRTGRMPIPEPSVGVRADHLSEADREAMAVYVAERFDLPGEIPTVGSGDASRGQELYVRNCAACHGAAGDGGISGANVWVPPLVDLDAVAIHQATRVGPFEMPAFDAAVLDDDDIEDIVGYLDVVAATPRTAVGVREVDQLTSSLFGLGLGLAAAVVVLVVARARRWYPRDPEGFHTAPPFQPRDEPGAEPDAGPSTEIPAESNP
jgi:ubiquinol-cytochrome c reductase cytochrome c subunit